MKKMTKPEKPKNIQDDRRSTTSDALSVLVIYSLCLFIIIIFY